MKVTPNEWRSSRRRRKESSNRRWGGMTCTIPSLLESSRPVGRGPRSPLRPRVSPSANERISTVPVCPKLGSGSLRFPHISASDLPSFTPKLVHQLVDPPLGVPIHPHRQETSHGYAETLKGVEKERRTRYIGTEGLRLSEGRPLTTRSRPTPRLSNPNLVGRSTETLDV